MEKLFIQARGGEKLSVIVDINKQAKGLVFLMHGLAGNQETSYMRAFAEAFYKTGFTVVRFDNRHGIGESEGEYKNANFTNNYQDLEDVIEWASKQDWYREPFVLLGHSMGAACMLWYTDKHLDKVCGLAPLAVSTGGKQALAKFKPDDFLTYGDLDFEQFAKDILKYEIDFDLGRFNMPLLMIVGDQDVNTPLEDQKKIYDKVSGPKEIHIIKGLKHTYKDSKHIREVAQIIKAWAANKF